MFGKKFSKSKRRRIRRAAVRTAAAMVCVFLLFSAFGCSVEEFQVTGNYHETEDEVRKMLGGGPFSNSSIILCLLNRNRKMHGNTFVDAVTVELDGLHGLKVNVSEKKLIGCVEYDNRYWYFNRAGVVLVKSDPIKPEEESMSAESAASEETAENEASVGRASEYSKKAPGQFLVKIAEPYEMSLRFNDMSDIRVIYLSEESEMSGEETEELFSELYEEDIVGADENAEGEIPEEEDYGTFSEEHSDGEDVDYGEESSYEPESNEELNTEASEAEDEYVEDESIDISEEEGDAGSDIIPPGEIIEPSAAAEGEITDPKNNTAEHQTWDIDTSAKGGNYLPVVHGLVFSEAAVGYPLPVQYDRVFSSIAVLKSFVDRSGYVPDYVTYDAEGNLIVTYGEASVNLGKGENIESRVAAVGKTLPSIAGLSGILHLENYDGTQNRFIFSKNKKTS